MQRGSCSDHASPAGGDHERQRVYVHRFLAGAEEKQRMENFCGHTLCVNPAHWTPVTRPASEDKPFFDPETEVSDCIQAVDGIGIARNLTYEGIKDHFSMIDYPEHIIREALQSLGGPSAAHEGSR